MNRLLLLSLAIVATTMAAQPTAMDVVNDMQPGWNLGNTFEAKHWNGADLYNNKAGLAAETSWQPTKTTQAVIDFVKAQGFRSVRIPCAWVCGHISDASAYTIDKQWMARVHEVVDYCINDGLYVVINDHWDGGWLEEHITDTGAQAIAKNKAVLQAIWTQIAEEFRDYDHHLLFAGLNEPGTSTAADVSRLVDYEQVFINAVRATGGNNATRILVVQGPKTDIDETVKYKATINRLTDTTEGRLAIEVHYYNPWQFWGMENDESWGKVFYYWGSGNHLSGSQHNATWGEESDMKAQLTKMKANFVDKGMPVIIGEFGANWRNISAVSGESQAKHNASIRAHYKEMHRLTKEMGGMAVMTWDINSCNQNGTKGTMTIIDRAHSTVFGTHAMAGINDIYPTPPANTVINDLSAAPSNATELYDMQGRKVSGVPQGGIYIRNGRKVAF